jgi:hypothetical protein
LRQHNQQSLEPLRAPGNEHDELKFTLVTPEFSEIHLLDV